MLRTLLLRRTRRTRRTRRAELPPADWARWHAARTLTDLGELTARWLDGTLATHAGYGDPDHPGPDPETAPLTRPLAAANRAGLVTISSQPGLAPTRGFDGAWWEQRAAIEALCDTATLTRLDQLATTTGLAVIAHRGARRWPRGRDEASVVTVTRSAGSDYTGFGTRLDRSDLRLQFGACRRSLHRRLDRAWQVTVIDPMWGRNDLLWPLLDRLADQPDSRPGGGRANPAPLSSGQVCW